MQLFILFAITIKLANSQQISKKVEISNPVIIGGLFPVHTHNATSPVGPCGPMLLDKGIQRLEAMLYAIDQINSNFSHWNFKLGTLILDTCSSDSYALEQSLQFLQHSCLLNSTANQNLIAVVGAANSAVSKSVANIFRLFKIPQVSYASTSEDLDDLHSFPYFFRVVPSDRFQVKVMMDILQEFDWTFVSLVASVGDYGDSAVRHFQQLVANSTYGDICIATIEKIPRDAEQADYATIVERLNRQEKAKVVIVFLNEDKIKELLRACEAAEIPENRFVWIGSDGWGAKERIVKQYKKRAIGAITILPKRFNIKGFDDYFTSLKPPNSRNPWFKEFWEIKFNCKLPRSRRKTACEDNDLSLSHEQEGLVPMVVDAVYTLATAIKTLCESYPAFCRGLGNADSARREQLLHIIANTSLNSSQENDMVVSFDKTRSVPVNYTIFQFQRQRHAYKYVPVGEWNPSMRLKMQRDLLWDHLHITDDNPISSCSQKCKPGAERIPDPDFQQRCCWKCRDCDVTEYQPDVYGPCIQCPEGQIPSTNRRECRFVKAVYIGEDFMNAWALVPFIFSITGLLCTLMALGVFFKYQKTPIVMAAGRELCYGIFFGIILCYCFPFIVISKPTPVTCGLLRIGIGLGLSICYSAIFTKTNSVSRIFEVSQKITKRPSYISPESQIIICVCLVLIQITLTAMWLIVEPPDVATSTLEASTKRVIFCRLDATSVLLGLMYNMVLLILCTFYAYKTRNIPENFNETKWISFTMYSSCIIWLAFIPSYCSVMQDHMVRMIILSMSVSASGTVILTCIFLPKIYVLIFHPERNIRYPESQGTNGTCDTSQVVHYLRTPTMDTTGVQPSTAARPVSPFFFVPKTETHVD